MVPPIEVSITFGSEEPPVSVPQKKLPSASVSIVLQEIRGGTLKAPAMVSPPLNVEVPAAPPKSASPVTSILPAKVDVPVPFDSKSPVVVAPAVERNSPMTVEDAFAIKPSVRVRRLAIDAVEEAERWPVTFRLLLRVEEAVLQIC